MTDQDKTALLSKLRAEGVQAGEPFDAEVLAERLRDVAASHYETAMGFGISRDNFERCATDAAKIARDMASAPIAGEAKEDLAPLKCPITGRPFFMALEHPELGMVPTYGGPYDSYTIPHLGGKADQPWHERELRVYRYDHDLGGWRTDEVEVIPLRIVHEDVLNERHDAAPQASEAVDLSAVSDIALEDEMRKRGAWVAPQADKDGGDCAKGGHVETANQPETRADIGFGGGLLDCAKGAVAPSEPLRVFSAGMWTYDGTGQAFSHTDLDAAAFVTYRDALSPTPSVVKQSLTATQTGEKGESDA